MPTDKDTNQNNNEPTRRTSLTTIQIVIKKSNEQEEKLQELTDKLKNSKKGSKVKLILKTFSEDDAAMLKL